VFLSAPQVARILESLNGTYKQFQERIKQQRETPEIPPPDEESPEGDDASNDE
jgi:hypothetical protein